MTLLTHTAAHTFKYARMHLFVQPHSLALLYYFGPFHLHAHSRSLIYSLTSLYLFPSLEPTNAFGNSTKSCMLQNTHTHASKFYLLAHSHLAFVILSAHTRTRLSLVLNLFLAFFMCLHSRRLVSMTTQTRIF